MSAPSQARDSASCRLVAAVSQVAYGAQALVFSVTTWIVAGERPTALVTTVTTVAGASGSVTSRVTVCHPASSVRVRLCRPVLETTIGASTPRLTLQTSSNRLVSVDVPCTVGVSVTARGAMPAAGVARIPQARHEVSNSKAPMSMAAPITRSEPSMSVSAVLSAVRPASMQGELACRRKSPFAASTKRGSLVTVPLPTASSVQQLTTVSPVAP